MKALIWYILIMSALTTIVQLTILCLSDNRTWPRTKEESLGQFVGSMIERIAMALVAAIILYFNR